MARLRRLSWLRLPRLSRLRLPGLRLWRLRRRILLRILGHLPLLLKAEAHLHQIKKCEISWPGPTKSTRPSHVFSVAILLCGNVVAHLSLLVITRAQGFQIH
jgi:hypothetical protein